MLCQWLSFFFLFSSFIYSNGADNSIAYNCPKSVCHGIEIKYPFWRLDNYNSSSPQYCGYPGFGISCSDQANPRFYLSDKSFYVKYINYSTHSLTLLDIGALDNSTCPRARHNHTLEEHKTPLKFSKRDIYLYFYYNCTHSPPHATLVDCLISSDGRSSYVYDEHDESEDFNWHGSCEDKVVVAVTGQGLSSKGPGATMGAAMCEGFVLDWQITAECVQCEASNGFCGFNNSTKENMCFCKDNCNKRRSDNVGLKIGIGIGAAAFTALIAGVSFFIYHRRQKKKSYYTTGSSLITKSILSYPSSTKDPERAIGVHLFDYNELEEATNNFDSEKELGDGGYGTVYKGKLRDGRVVAVKRLYENNGRRVEQFMNEIEILSKLHHPNLVSLYGCTSRHSRELLLVYEYIPNGTIADHLHGGKDSKRGSLSWATRMKITIETASALVYLHASDVIHRDVKTNNILLDDNFRVKVADFGLSRLFPAHATHVSTAPQGTPGYLDPEYHECYQLTDKSDVYSFGVVLIELISALPAVDIFRHRHEINLSNMAINKIQSNALHELVDSNLGFDSNEKVRTMIAAVAELAFQCLQSESDMRPSMQEVLESLLRIQRMNKTTGKPENISPGEDIGFSKIGTFVSPDSVTAKWSSNSTTPNAST